MTRDDKTFVVLLIWMLAGVASCIAAGVLSDRLQHAQDRAHDLQLKLDQQDVALEACRLSFGACMAARR